MRAFSTLEAVIAMAVLVMALSGVALTLFGNQSLLASTQVNAEAEAKAQAMIENARAIARKDFRLVVSTTTQEDGYDETLSVSDSGAFFAKNILATVRFVGGASQQEVAIPGLIADFDNAVGGSTCSATLAGDWGHPALAGFDFAALVHDTGSAYPITDIDANNGRLYMSVNNTSANAKPTFFIFDIKNPATPTLLGSLDTSSVSAGLNAIVVATSSTQNYAYAANAFDANFRTCKLGGNCSQLQVIDISNPAAPKVAVNFELSTSSPPFVLGNGGAGNAVGKSIFYKNGYVYLGLSKTTIGPEFNIIDVKDPLHPKWVGSYPAPGNSSGNAVNAIFVQRNHAYLATPNAKELTVLDISNPANPIFIGTYDAPGGSGNGSSLDVVGDTLYMGRTVGNKEFYILDVSNPPAPTLLGERDTGSATVSGVLIRDYLAFLAVGSQFQIWNVRNPTNVTPVASLAFPSGSSGTALNCEGNTVYAGSVLGNTGFLSVVSAP